MLKIDVALPNGHAELLTLLPSSTVQDVRTKAERAFGKKYLRLITVKNRVLVDPDKTLEEAEIEDGECLTALALQPKLAATLGAFALWCHEGAIVTCGDAFCGGHSSAGQHETGFVYFSLVVFAEWQVLSRPQLSHRNHLG